MKRVLAAAIALMMAFVPFAGTGWAASPTLDQVYPERRADGNVYTIGQWSDGSYTYAVREYPEQRADGSVVYVFVWDNGNYSVAVRQYSERREDGSVWLVRQWQDGTYAARRQEASAPTTPSAPTPPSSTSPATADASREGMVAFMNHFWPIARQLNRCSTALNTKLPTLDNRLESIGTIDTWVKCFEPHMPAVAALEAPPIPYVQAFVKGYKESILLEFDAGKRLNWGLVTNNASVVAAALSDLSKSGKQETQAFWELNAAAWQYGLRYDERRGPYGTWY